MVLCRKGTSGRARIEMYRSEESVSGSNQPLRMVDLETVRSVQPVGEPPLFCRTPPPLSVSVSVSGVSVFIEVIMNNLYS